MAIATTLSRVGGFGVQEANVNLGSSEGHLRPALATNSVVLAGLLGGMTAAGVAAIALLVPLFGNASATLVTAALVSLPFLILSTYLWRLIQADYRFRLSSVAWLLPFVVNVVVNGALALAGVLTVGAAFATWLAGQAVELLFLIWRVARRGGFGRPDAALARRTISFGLKTYAGRIMLLGNYRLDQWILGSLGSTRELGLYNIAVSLSATLYQLPSALVLAQRPDLVRGSRAAAARQASVAFRLAGATTLAGAALMAAFAPWLCTGIFGSEFSGSADDLRVLMLGTLGIVALKILGNALTAQRLPMLETAAIAVGLVTTIVLDVILIPSHGGLGAAVASSIAYTAAGVAVIVIFLRALPAQAADLVPRPGDGSLAWTQFRRLVAARF
jgi:O-antigen/teichoic acid export membrane protein